MKTQKKVTTVKLIRLALVLLSAFILIPKENADAQPMYPYIDLKVKAGLQGLFVKERGELCEDFPITVQLRESREPYGIAAEAQTEVDKSTMTATVRFHQIGSGTYYIVVKHTNSIETWSKEGGEALTESTLNEFDFTASGSAYGDNQFDNGKLRLIYSGDVNQDGVIDGTDFARVDDDVLGFVTGDVATDLNGDETVDGSDLAIVDVNSASFVAVNSPLGTDTQDYSDAITRKASLIKVGQSYPNPFNPTTTINFNLSSETNVRLTIYDITGREVSTLVNQRLSAGDHQYQWNAGNFSSGVYFYRISAPGFEETKQMNLIK